MAKKGDLITGDEIRYHDDPATKHVAIPQGMTLPRLMEIIERIHHMWNSVEQLEPEKYRYRPNDVAVAVSRVLKRRYGATINAGTASLFGENPPTFKSIPVSLTETVEVATGRILIPELEEAEIYIGTLTDRKWGEVGAITATMKRKDRDEVKGLLADIREELRTNSIYRGRALKIVPGEPEPQFLDTSKFPTFDQLVYSQRAMRDIEGSVLYRIRHREAAEAEGIPFKSAHLYWGPYGTGKTSGIQAAALEALDRGITVVFSEPGADIRQLIQTAELYSPAIAVIEDIDTVASTGEADEVSELLDVFDGIDRKSGDVMVLMTTNHVEKLHRGFLRAGRCDTAVYIGHLDLPGVEALTRTMVPEHKLDPDVDFAQVFEAAERYTPSFLAEMLHRAKLYALGRLKGDREYILTTEDLVAAAESLRDHHNLMEGATEGKQRPTLDAAFESVVRRASEEVNGVTRLERDGVELGELVVEKS